MAAKAECPSVFMLRSAKITKLTNYKCNLFTFIVLCALTIHTELQSLQELL